MKKGFAIFLAGLTVWGVSVLVGPPPAPTVFDPDLGVQTPVPGSMQICSGEGASITHYAEHGLNPEAVRKWDGKGSATIMLYGDSYIESHGVADSCKPDARLGFYLRKRGVNLAALGVGKSGLGFEGMIRNAVAFERLIGTPACHVFFTADIRDDLLNDSGVSSEDNRNALSLRIQCFLGRFKLNFVNRFCGNVRSLVKRGGGYPSLSSNRRQVDDLNAEAERTIRKLRAAVKGRCLIVYCPGVPKVTSGRIVCEDERASDGRMLEKVARQSGCEFLDVSSALVDLWTRNKILGRGFPNLAGPGRGHLNAAGIDAVFDCVAGYLESHHAVYPD